MSTDLSAFVLDLAADTKAFVDKAVALHVSALTARCQSLEQEVQQLKSLPLAERGEKGLDGANGKDADLSLLLAMQSDLSAMKGEWTAFKEWQAGAVADAFAKLQPRDGKDGKDGKDGADGIPGRDGRDGVAGPPGEKGADGLHGKDGRDGVNGKDGADGMHGKDGLNGINGKDGADGLHGKDGLGFDDLDLTFSETTGHILKMSSGDRVKEWPLYAPFYAGTWESGVVYPKGAMLTDHGALYTARMATSARPGQPNAESRAWRLAVKSGKDGKNGKDGKDGV